MASAVINGVAENCSRSSFGTDGNVRSGFFLVGIHAPLTHGMPEHKISDSLSGGGLITHLHTHGAFCPIKVQSPLPATNLFRNQWVTSKTHYPSKLAAPPSLLANSPIPREDIQVHISASTPKAMLTQVQIVGLPLFLPIPAQPQFCLSRGSFTMPAFGISSVGGNDYSES